MTRRTVQPVTSTEEAVANILIFNRELSGETRLQDRLSRVHAWYAHRSLEGGWVFAPSKFIGYRDNTASQYLETAKHEANGGETERAIERLGFINVDLDTRLGRELDAALTEYLTRWSKVPRKGYRIGCLPADNEPLPRVARPDFDPSGRISFDPNIAGGRPCIKGTRMRVSDIVEMLAHGAERAEILADYPYLTTEDITAALDYAARAVDHRVLRAA